MYKKKIFLALLFIKMALVLALGAPPIWTVNPANYQYNMTGFIRVKSLSGTFVNESGTMIRALKGSSTRGVVDSTDIIFISNEAYFPITISSNVPSSDTIHFEVYLTSTDSVYSVSEYIIFDRFESIGSVSDPFILTIGICYNHLILHPEDFTNQREFAANSSISLDGIFNPFADSILLSAPVVRVPHPSSIYNTGNLVVSGEGCVE